MCVAIPGRVIWIGAASVASRPSLVRVGDVDRSVDLIMVPEAEVGDWVIAHSGYAIRRLPEASVEAWLRDTAAQARLQVATSRFTSAPTASAR